MASIERATPLPQVNSGEQFTPEENPRSPLEQYIDQFGVDLTWTYSPMISLYFLSLKS